MLIFATLFMILLFNSTHKIWLDNSDEGVAIPLLPEHASLMTIEYGGVKLERIGRGWRLNPQSNVSGESLARVASAWQEAYILPVASIPAESPPYVIVIWLAGEAEGRVFKIFDDQNHIIEYNGQQFQLAQGEIAELFVPGVI